MTSAGLTPFASRYCGTRPITTGAVKRQRDRQVSISALSQADMDKLCTADCYPSDSFTFSSHGYDLHINNELVADAFASLSAQM